MSDNSQIDKVIRDLADAMAASSRSSTDIRNLQRLIAAAHSMVVGQGSSLDIKIALLTPAYLLSARGAY